MYSADYIACAENQSLASGLVENPYGHAMAILPV